MKNLENIYKVPLPSACCQCYEGIAFDGCYYYVTKPQSCIVMKYTKHFEPVGYFRVCRKYSKICYDSSEECFWATGWCSCYCIYKLDCCFNEIDRIMVFPDLDGCRIITGISYDCENNSLLVSFEEKVLNVYKNGDFEVLLTKTGTGSFCNVLSISPYFVILYRTDSNQSIKIYDEDKNVIAEYEVPYEYSVKDMVLLPKVKGKRKKAYICLLTAKSCCYPYILLKRLPINELGLEIADCNFELEPCAECDGCCCNFCGDVMKSIAEVESSLAGILDAEGKKLEKIVKSTDDYGKIMQANKSVNRVVNDAACVEFMLYKKLQTLLDSCCNDCDKED